MSIESLTASPPQAHVRSRQAPHFICTVKVSIISKQTEASNDGGARLQLERCDQRTPSPPTRPQYRWWQRVCQPNTAV